MALNKRNKGNRGLKTPSCLSSHALSPSPSAPVCQPPGPDKLCDLHFRELKRARGMRETLPQDWPAPPAGRSGKPTAPPEMGKSAAMEENPAKTLRRNLLYTSSLVEWQRAGSPRQHACSSRAPCSSLRHHFPLERRSLESLNEEAV